jgi:hypothetical protein
MQLEVPLTLRFRVSFHLRNGLRSVNIISMKGKNIVTALLLTIALTGNAAAADSTIGPESKASKKAKKLHAYLDVIGMNDPRIVNFIQKVDANMEDGQLKLYENKMEYGRMVLLYEAKPSISSKNIQLKFQPTNYPHTEVIMTTKSVMINYHYEFK